MSRYRGPKLRITRRLGTLPGLTTKKSNKVNRAGKTEMLMLILVRN
jgi:small subunit ribosomal protein S4